MQHLLLLTQAHRKTVECHERWNFYARVLVPLCSLSNSQLTNSQFWLSFYLLDYFTALRPHLLCIVQYFKYFNNFRSYLLFEASILPLYCFCSCFCFWCFFICLSSSLPPFFISSSVQYWKQSCSSLWHSWIAFICRWCSIPKTKRHTKTNPILSNPQQISLNLFKSFGIFLLLCPIDDYYSFIWEIFGKSHKHSFILLSFTWL